MKKLVIGLLLTVSVQANAWSVRDYTTFSETQRVAYLIGIMLQIARTGLAYDADDNYKLYNVCPKADDLEQIVEKIETVVFREYRRGTYRDVAVTDVINYHIIQNYACDGV
jgi:hypothetical protein